MYHDPLGSYFKFINKIFKSTAPESKVDWTWAHSKEWHHDEGRGGESGAQEQQDHRDTSAYSIGVTQKASKREQVNTKKL